jgi:hypothetical protein
MLAETQDEGQIIARVAALDIGKAELVCCVRVHVGRLVFEDGSAKSPCDTGTR